MKQSLLANAGEIVGTITDPWGGAYGTDTQGQGLITLLNNILKTATVLAGIFVLINIITAGYQFMSAEGETEKITKAWSKIWQSLLGLVIIAGAYILAAFAGYLVFGEWQAIISPTIYGPELQP